MDIIPGLVASSTYDLPKDRTSLIVTVNGKLVGCNFMQGDDIAVEHTDVRLTEYVIAAIGNDTTADGWMERFHDVCWKYIGY